MYPQMMTFVPWEQFWKLQSMSLGQVSYSACLTWTYALLFLLKSFFSRLPAKGHFLCLHPLNLLYLYAAVTVWVTSSFLKLSLYHGFHWPFLFFDSQLLFYLFFWFFFFPDPLTLPSPCLGCLMHFVSVTTISIWTTSTWAMCRRSPMCDSIIRAEGQSCCSQR